MELRCLVLLAVVLVSVSSGASAAPQAAPPAELAGVMDCRAQADADARLRCYDQSVARLSKALSSGDLVALDRQSLAKQRRALFGFSLPKIGLFGADDAPEQRELEATIKRASEVGDGKWVLTLDDGSRWQTTEAVRRQGPPRANRRIKIRRGAIGGFMASIDGGPLTRIKRVE